MTLDVNKVFDVSKYTEDGIKQLQDMCTLVDKLTLTLTDKELNLFQQQLDSFPDDVYVAFTAALQERCPELFTDTDDNGDSLPKYRKPMFNDEGKFTCMAPIENEDSLPTNFFHDGNCIGWIYWAKKKEDIIPALDTPKFACHIVQERYGYILYMGTQPGPEWLPITKEAFYGACS